MPRVALATAAMAATVLTASPAQAHNQFTGSTPAEGAMLTEAASTLVLEFSGAIDDRLTDLAVTGPDGAVIEAGDPTVSGGTLEAEIVFTETGPHRIGYRVVSSDGHPVEGEIAFTVDLPAETAAPSTSEARLSASEATPDYEDGLPGWLPTALVAAGIALIGALALTINGRRR